MSRQNKRKSRKRPGPEVRRRTAPPSKARGKTLSIFAEESARAFAADAKLASAICRERALPIDVAQAAYATAERLLTDDAIDAHGVGKVASGVAAIAKMDIETARFQGGEPAIP
jgi:hypothetical protein